MSRQVTIRAYFLATASFDAMWCAMTPASPGFYASVLAKSYAGLGLHHLDQPVGRLH